MRFTIIVGALVVVLLSGCGSDASTRTTPDGPSETNLPGSDRDADGCILSAGYAWCARTRQCERPWELAEQKGFTNTPEAFDDYCDGVLP